MACDESNLAKFPCVLRNVLIIISNTVDLSSVLKSIGPLAATIVATLYLLALYLLVITKSHKYLPFNSCSETLLKSTCKHLLLLVGFNTLTYQKDYDRSPTLVGHQDYFLAPYFCLFLFFIMERSPFISLFHSEPSTTPTVNKGPPPTECTPLKIPMRIIDRAMHNLYAGD